MRQFSTVERVLAATVSVGISLGTLTGCTSAFRGYTEVTVNLSKSLPFRTYQIDVLDEAGKRIGGGNLQPGSGLTLQAQTETVKVHVPGVCDLSTTGHKVTATISAGRCSI